MGLDDADELGNLAVPYMPKVNTAYAFMFICVPWDSSFVDGGKGETVAGATPASFAQAIVAKEDGAQSTQIWSGTLDRSGCTGALNLADYQGYRVFLQSKMTNGGATIDVGAGAELNAAPHLWELAIAFSTLKVLRPPSQGPVYIRTKPRGAPEYVTSAAAVASAALVAADVILDAPLVVPPGNYMIEANSRCMRGTGNPDYPACTAAQTLYLGPNPDGTHNTQFKFVVAHELGHAAKSQSVGFFSIDYTKDWPKTDPLEQGSCGCGFVSDPSDQAHCLQSRQKNAAVQEEGFGHFFAANLWNTRAPNTCTFVYYKNFRNDDATITKPPMAKSCAAPARWLDKHCPAAARGVEWDWLDFLRAVSASTSNRIPMSDLLAIWRNACGNGTCEGKEVSYAQIDSAARGYYGNASSRYSAFQAASVANGVAH